MRQVPCPIGRYFAPADIDARRPAVVRPDPASPGPLRPGSVASAPAGRSTWLSIRPQHFDGRRGRRRMAHNPAPRPALHGDLSHAQRPYGRSIMGRKRIRRVARLPRRPEPPCGVAVRPGPSAARTDCRSTGRGRDRPGPRYPAPPVSSPAPRGRWGPPARACAPDGAHRLGPASGLGFQKRKAAKPRQLAVPVDLIHGNYRCGIHHRYRALCPRWYGVPVSQVPAPSWHSKVANNREATAGTAAGSAPKV